MKISIVAFRMPNSDTSSVTKISQREATTTDDKDIPDELIQSGRLLSIENMFEIFNI